MSRLTVLRGGVAVESWDITVSAANLPPAFPTRHPTTVPRGRLTPVSALSIDPDIGLSTWTDSETVGVYHASVQVTDDEGSRDT